MVTTSAEQQFIYQAIYSDGRVVRTQPRRYRPGQRGFVGLATLIARQRDPGVRAVRMIRTGDSDWVEG
jgi:hypothetical protein